jgi:hypothetical protein
MNVPKDWSLELRLRHVDAQKSENSGTSWPPKQHSIAESLVSHPMPTGETMLSPKSLRTAILAMALSVSLVWPAAGSESADVEALIGALLGETPLVEDLRQLTDEIGGRPTGSRANLAAVEWSHAKFEEAGVNASMEAFLMPGGWLEKSCEARISGDVDFKIEAVSMPFSIPTRRGGTRAVLLDAGRGTDEDFAILGGQAAGAFLLVETPPLLDIDGLFREYKENVEIERLASDAGAAGVVYMSSRAEGLLYRHNARGGFDNGQLVLAMERASAQRAMRLLRSGNSLDLWVRVDLEDAAPFESYNVIGEIRGSELADEFVVIGAHLDSWGLGTGANDNGCNVSMMIDIARQMKRLGIQPRRTIRFALWNG